MCEIVIIAAVLAVAIEIKCGDLFNARQINYDITEQLRQADGDLPCCDSADCMDSDKDLPVFCSRKHKSEKAEKNNTIND